MKKLIYMFTILISSYSTFAQTVKIDQEKLLEFYQTQRYAEAATYLQSIYSKDTENPKELAQLGYASMMAGNLPGAEKNYLLLYKQQPESLPVLFNLANISRRRGDDSKSKLYYLEIIKLDSMNFNVYKQLAAMIPVPIDPEKVIYLKKANAIQPANPDVAFDLASSLNMSKKNDSAYAVLQTALTADTSNFMLLKAKLPVCIALKKLDEAIVTGEKLMLGGDSSSYVLNNIGVAYFAKKEFDKSLKLFMAIENREEQNESTLYYTAMCYRELKNYDLAAMYMKRSIKEGISPYTSKYYRLLGEIYEKNALLTNANQAYHKSLDFENEGTTYYNLGLINDYKLNRKQSALKYYKQYLDSKPDTALQKDVITYVKSRVAALQK